MKRVDLVGQRFGRLTVIARAGTRKDRAVYWSCQCECGGTTLVVSKHLLSGESQSCGCLKNDLLRERSTTHGATRYPEYEIWQAMIGRCSRPASSGYRNYGGRGIAVCERWRDSFEAFLADVGRRPSPLHSIDRIDNDGNYEPGNVRWATREQQVRNRSCSINFRTLEDDQISITEMSRRLAIRQPQLKTLLVRAGVL